MILTLFTLFITISLILIILGTYIKAPPAQLGGYLFMFILGLTLMLGNLQYVNGSTETYTYQADNSTIDAITTAYTYSDYSGEIIQGIEVNHVIGFFLCLLSAFGWIITLTTLERFDTNQDPYQEYKK